MSRKKKTRKTRKQGTGNRTPNAPASALKKPLEEERSKDKIREFRNLLLKENGNDQIANVLKQKPEHITVVAELLGDDNPIVRRNAADAVASAAGKLDISCAILDLVKALGDKDGYVRERAAWALEKALDNEKNRTGVLNVLIKALGDKNWVVRENVRGALAIAADNEAITAETISALIKVLGDKDKTVRCNAAEAFADIILDYKDISKAIPALAKMLGDEDSHNRNYVANVLGSAVVSINRDAALDALLKALGEKNSDVQMNAARGLGEAAKYNADISPAIPALAELLEDECMDVRKEAADALIYAAKVECSSVSAISALGKAWEYRYADVRNNIIRSLDYLFTYGFDISLALAIPALAKELVPVLAEALAGKNNEVRCRASKVLLNAAEKGVDISTAIPALIKALGDEDSDVRSDTANALWKATENGGRDTRLTITKLMGDLTNSHEFIIEAEKNSDIFLWTTKALSELLQNMRAMGKAA